MTRRKPKDVGWESWVEGEIRVAMERGDFDDLPGKGRPIAGLDGTPDEMWWVREKLRREEVSFLPPTLEVRRELDEARRTIASMSDESRVREVLAKVNERIRYVNSHVVEGPPSTLMPLDLDDEIARWRETRPPAAPEDAQVVREEAAPSAVRRWSRRRR